MDLVHFHFTELTPLSAPLNHEFAKTTPELMKLDSPVLQISSQAYDNKGVLLYWKL